MSEWEYNKNKLLMVIQCQCPWKDIRWAIFDILDLVLNEPEKDNKCLKTLRTWKNNTFYLLHSHSEEQLYLYNQGKYHFANIFIFEINTRTHRNIWKLIVTLRRYVALTIWLVVVVAARNYKKNIFKLSIVHCQLPTAMLRNISYTF